jgi:hypothetical protein
VGQSPPQLPTLSSTLSKTSPHLQVKIQKQIFAFKIKLFHGKQSVKFKIIYLLFLYILFTVALHAQQIEELRDKYVRERDALLLEASKEKQRIISGATYNEELLQTIRFKMLNEMDTWTSVWKETYKLKTDEVKTNVGRTSSIKLGSCWVLN